MLRSARRLWLLVVLSLVFSAGVAAPVAAAPADWVVDDDRVQCAKADFTSIAEAVADERVDDGDFVRVCAGLYPASVTITKSITLKGDPEAIDAIDCFQLSLPVDPTLHAIVDPAVRTPTGDSFGLKLRADGIVVSGLVFQDGYLGIDASDEYSGYRISHNLFRSNAYFGIEFGSKGEMPSRADHNCFWQNAVLTGEVVVAWAQSLTIPTWTSATRTIERPTTPVT